MKVFLKAVQVHPTAKVVLECPIVKAALDSQTAGVQKVVQVCLTGIHNPKVVRLCQGAKAAQDYLIAIP